MAAFESLRFAACEREGVCIRPSVLPSSYRDADGHVSLSQALVGAHPSETRHHGGEH